MAELRPRVLVVDDNRADIDLIRIAFEMVGVAVDLVEAGDGESGLAALARCAAEGRCPRLLLLDLNMPRLSGFDVLERLRGSSACADMPVVILTSSERPVDRERVLALGAAAYHTKPAVIDEFLDLMRGLARYLEEPSGERVSPAVSP